MNDFIDNAADAGAPAEQFDALLGQATAAAQSRDWPTAEQIWRDLLRIRPEAFQPMVGLAEALLQQKRYDEAERLFITAQISAPDSRGVAEALARVAAGREDWEEAERRWSAVLTRSPESAAAWHGVALSRRNRGDVVGAEQCAAAAADKFPTDMAILNLFASLANETKDWSQAAQRWDRVRKLSPLNLNVWLLQANALIALSQKEEAASLLREAARMFPDHAEIAGLRLKLSLIEEDWLEASLISIHMAELAPGNRRLQQSTFELAWRALGSVDQKAAAQIPLQPIYSPQDDSHQILKHFQGFGDDQEFAMVERYFGAEPLTLLRFADIPITKLTAALNSDLAGIGESENTVLGLGGDYIIRDKRYNFSSHTFIREKPSDPEKFFADQCLRWRYLSGEFLDDLTDGEKIFIYKSTSSDPLPEIERLHAAMRKLGKATLLYVRLADEGHQRGTVQQVKPGLLIGYLDSFFDEQNGGQIDVEGWLGLCFDALKLVDGADVTLTAELSLKRLLLRFESMGSSCEFGHVQRRNGAEPLGWLRWTRTSLAALTEVIENGVSGFGDPENTEIFTPDDYRATDPRFDLSMRTFTKGDHAAHDRIFEEHCRRMKLLIGKLRDDLRVGEKIFLNKSAVAGPLDDVLSLHAAMRRHGPSVLFHIRPAEPDHPSGSVRAIAPGLFVGHLEGLTARGGFWNVPYEGWVELCRKCLEMKRTIV
jgi:tetratricopeptide (TPR) repeat protein